MTHPWLERMWSLPLPPSANDLWVPVDGRLVKSAEYKAWEALALASLRVQGGTFQPVTGDLPLRIQAKYVLGRLSADQPNRTKALYDRLNGVLWHDDRQLTLEGPNRKLIAVGGEKPHVEFVVAVDLQCDDETKQRLERAWRNVVHNDALVDKAARLARNTRLPQPAIYGRKP